MSPLRRSFTRIPGAALLGFLLAANPPAVFALPDTGITTCYDEAGSAIPCPQPGEPFYGQDANFGPGVKTCRDNGNGTITDLDAGLTWEIKGGADTLNDADALYTWKEAGDYILLLNARKYGGHADWRLPTVKELGYLADYSLSPPVNRAYFPNCRCAPHWSGTPDAPGDGTSYWLFDFATGNTSTAAATESFRVRAVRTGGPE